jgi:protein-disulfide isomerase
MAMPAAQWFEALYLQSPEKAWTFHDQLFENQSKLGEEYFKALAKDLGLDVAKAAKDAKSDAVRNKIEADIKEAKGFGIEGTPAYLINGVPLRGACPVSRVRRSSPGSSPRSKRRSRRRPAGRRASFFLGDFLIDVAFQ